MDRQALLALYDQELRIDIEYPEARKEALPLLVRFVRPAPGMNLIGYSRLDGTDVDAAIREQVAYFRQMDQPFEWEVFDHDLPRDLRERLAAHGFAPNDLDDPDMVMVLDLREAPAELLRPVAADVRPITERGQLEEVISLEERVWGGNFGWMRKRIGDHLAIPGYLSMYLVYVDGQAACVGWTYFYRNSQFAGLWGGSTLPEYRKRGLYTALLATRVQEAIRRGRRYLTINAGKMSRPIVERHGFDLLTNAYSCVWRGDTS